MFTVTTDDINPILHDYGICGKCTVLSELQRYHYEKDDPDSKEVRLIVKAETDDRREFVIRFKNEKDVTPDIINAQSRFAALLADRGIETPTVYSSDGLYARRYRIRGYDVIVTVEDFVSGELREVDAETAEKTGRLLARMHSIAEAYDFHVQNDVLFHPLKDNDLFSFEAFSAQKNFLVTVDDSLYRDIVDQHANLLREVRCFEDEPQYAVQGDISDCNLFQSPSGEIGVFDFNRCGDNVLYYDAVMQAIFEARLMDYPKEYSENPEKVILPAFIKGYQKERPFTDRQMEVFPSLYALVSAFWLSDVKWGEHSLANAVKNADPDAALKWMRTIRDRLSYLPPMPV